MALWYILFLIVGGGSAFLGSGVRANPKLLFVEREEKGSAMETKALKKQMGAAIAMVLVAAIALAASTFAWFVSNNRVEATTTNISAQSNSAYLVIDKVATSTTSTSSVSAGDTNTPLYPAKITKSTSGAAEWRSAYAETAGASTMKANTEFIIDDGTAAKAVAAGYGVKNTFYIGTGTYDGEFTNLHITGVTVDTETTTGDSGNKNLGNAMRVLVVCGNDWQVWSAEGEKLSSSKNTGAAFTTGVKKSQDATVDVYLYYDGDDTNVYSDNLANLTSNGVTITFEATPKEYRAAPTA